MKAIVFQEHGGDEKLHLSDLPTPEPSHNHVLIRLKAASLNHVDIWVRNGSPAYPVILPHILGADGAGVIEGTGADVEGVSVGDRVMILPAMSCGVCGYCKKNWDNQCDNFEILGTKHRGTYAEHVAVPDQNIVPIPENWTFEEAAAFPLTYLTAWHMLVTQANIQPNETVLITGASSGIGIAAIQIAKLKNAVVLAVTTRPDKAERIKAAGADDVFVANTNPDFSPWARQFTSGQGVDIVFEHVGPATWDFSLKSLRKYGRLVTCGATTGPKIEMELRSVFGRNISILGSRMGTRRDFSRLCQTYFNANKKPLIDSVFPLEKADEAHRRMEKQDHVGKIVLKID